MAGEYFVMKTKDCKRVIFNFISGSAALVRNNNVQGLLIKYKRGLCISKTASKFIIKYPAHVENEGILLVLVGRVSINVLLVHV